MFQRKRLIPYNLILNTRDPQTPPCASQIEVFKPQTLALQSWQSIVQGTKLRSEIFCFCFLSVNLIGPVSRSRESCFRFLFLINIFFAIM